MNNICIVTSGHPPFDERIYWKFACSLKENGYTTTIISSTLDISKDEEGIYIQGFNGENLSKSEKINKLKAYLTEFQPDYIICCEPLTILAARAYQKQQKNNTKVIADITEWYPENVSSKLSFPKRFFVFLMLYLFNIYAVNQADALIIGEEGKKKRYDFIAPFKKKVIIGYYPVLKYFHYSLPDINTDYVLCYAGLISFQRGIKTLLKAASGLASRHPYLNIRVKLLGKFQSADEQREFLVFSGQFKKITVEYAGWTSYDKISDHLRDVHICFDLRIRNFIYNNSLPIKIFEYMAAGKPFIYSDIQPIKDEIDYDYCGQLVNPYSINDITEAAEKYLKDRNLLAIHSRNGRMMIENDMNWEKESEKLIDLIRHV
jgi:glycosyltransferase involved in cell wall biosynthesis